MKERVKEGRKGGRDGKKEGKKGNWEGNRDWLVVKRRRNERRNVGKNEDT